MTTYTVFKICDRDSWLRAERDGVYRGSSDDARDGFIHFSTAEQLAGTAAKWFRNKPGLVLIAFTTSTLGAELRWEPSRGGDLFPHLYGELDPTLALWMLDLPLADDGVPILPATLDDQQQD